MDELRKALEMSSLVWGKPDVTSPDTDTQVSYKDIKGERWIAFEATDSWRDVLTHLQLWPVKFQGKRAHAGFVRAYRSVRTLIRSWVVTSPYPVVWTGHSLGGALANLACAEYGGQVVTTGAPRVWWGSPPEIKVIRYEAEGDPVPHVPPLYRHAGQVIPMRGKDTSWKAHLPENYKSTLK